MVRTKNMVTYIIKRVLFMVPMLFIALTLSFVLAQMMSVDPLLNKMDMMVDIEFIEAERVRMGFYDPLHIKLLKYYQNFFTGNWGDSYVILEGLPVLTLIGKIFPKTIELVIIPVVLIPIISVKLGVLSAKHRNQFKDGIVRGFMMLGVCIPIFWLATMIQVLVGNYLSYFTFGSLNLETMNPNSITMRYPDPEWPFSTGFRLIDGFLHNDQILIQDTLLHLLLPAFCLIIVSLATITRQTRSSMLDVMERDYVRTARAKGVPEQEVINKHSLRNALIPTSTVIVSVVAGALTGVLLLEVSFNYTGMGYFMVSAIQQGDYVVINGILVFIVIIVLTGTLVSDVLYTIIDPRIVYS